MQEDCKEDVESSGKAAGERSIDDRICVLLSGMGKLLDAVLDKKQGGHEGHQQARKVAIPSVTSAPGWGGASAGKQGTSYFNPVDINNPGPGQSYFNPR